MLPSTLTARYLARNLHATWHALCMLLSVHSLLRLSWITNGFANKWPPAGGIPFLLCFSVYLFMHA